MPGENENHSILARKDTTQMISKFLNRLSLRLANSLSFCFWGFKKVW